MIDLEKLRSQALNGLPMSSVYVLELLDHIAQLEKDAGRYKLMMHGDGEYEYSLQVKISKGKTLYRVYADHLEDALMCGWCGADWRSMPDEAIDDAMRESKHG